MNPPGAGPRRARRTGPARDPRLVQVDPGDPARPGLGGDRQLIQHAVGQEADVGAVQGGGEPVRHPGQPVYDNQIQVTTSGIDGFTLSPEHPPAAVTIDGAAMRIKPAAPLSFVKTAQGWRAGAFAPQGKRAGAEGPIVEAVSGRHIYVYGSLGTRTADELEERRQVAQAAAAWSSVRSHLMLSLPLKADSEVTDADMDSGDLVLFGTAESNSVIARIAAALPLELHPGAADYGLLFIAPIGKRYALVSSGLPWWSGADTRNRGGDPFAPAQYRLLSTFGDYVLFEGSLGHVVAEGRFDRNWKVPADVAAKMTSTGTVTVH